MKLGYVGSGPISNFHLPALKSNGFDISAIGSTKNSERCRNIADKFNLQEALCEGGWEEVLEKDVDAYCICIDTSATPSVLNEFLNKNKPILVEKPIGWNKKSLKTILDHPMSNNIFVAYNRRFYRTSEAIKTHCESSSGGTIVLNIPDSIAGIRQFLVNGCHMIDLLRYIAGDFKIIHKTIKYNEKEDDISSISALCENKKWNILINAHSLIPSNFSITVNSNLEVFELKPIEKFISYKGLEIIEPTKIEPIRKYMPKVDKMFVESSQLKPGFDLMYKCFKEFIYNGRSQTYCSLHDAILTLDTCWELLDCTIANQFNNFEK